MRLQFEVSKAKMDELKDLMKQGDMRTYAELFNNATTLMKWAINVVEGGRTIVAYDEETERMRELVMPFLDYVAEHRPLVQEADTTAAVASSHRVAVNGAD